tara:strand:- start:787 stop:1728 length:942 start_codon:yes stop_codon:yes gene_type:complete
MVKTIDNQSPIELRKIGRKLRKLCSKQPMDGVIVDEAIAIIRKYNDEPRVINSHTLGGLPPIMLAYSQDNPLNYAITVELLKTDCIDTTFTYPDKCTLLHRAAHRGDNNLTEMLLKKNRIDINARDSHGYTALMYASHLEDSTQVAALLKLDHTDVNAKTKNGITALIIASQRKYLLTSAELLAQHPDIDVDAIFEKGELRTNALCEILIRQMCDTDFYMDYSKDVPDPSESRKRNKLKSTIIKNIIDKSTDLSFRYHGRPNVKTEYTSNFWAKHPRREKTTYHPNKYTGQHLSFWPFRHRNTKQAETQLMHY